MGANLVSIAEVFIDEQGKLCLRPEPPHDFSHVYRSAMEVHWDKTRACLYSPVPREWTYARWYEQIGAAVLGEYGVRLIPTKSTVLKNLPPEVRHRVQQDITQA
jgi:hypothetical protein